MGARAKSFKVRIEDFEAEDVRAFYDSSMLRVWHLQGKPRRFRIVRVQRITKQEGDEVEKRACVRLANSAGEEFPLPLELNPTNRDTIIGLYGTKPKAWIGHVIELYPTECEAFGKLQPCIRIRNYNPEARRDDGERQAYTNRQGVHVLPPQQQPARRTPPPPAPAQGESSGLELDDSDDLIERNQYVDTSHDPQEPPAGALETDFIR